MTPKELLDDFNKLHLGQTQDTETRYAELADKIDGIETSFANQLEAKFQELLTRLPPQAPAPQQRQNPNGQHRRARHVPLPAHVAAGAPAFDDAYEDDADELNEEVEDGEVDQPPPGRPRPLNRNARAPPPPVRDDDHVEIGRAHV